MSPFRRRAGPVEIAIQLETVEEKPLPAKAVAVTLTNARSKAKLKPIDAERRGEDKWLAKVTLPAAGRWTLGLGITISDTDKVSIEAPIVSSDIEFRAENRGEIRWPYRHFRRLPALCFAGQSGFTANLILFLLIP